LNISPVDTGPLVSEVAKQGALEAFMLLVILALFGVAVYLYKDGRADRKETTDALGDINTTLAALKEVINVIVNKI